MNEEDPQHQQPPPAKKCTFASTFRPYPNPYAHRTDDGRDRDHGQGVQTRVVDENAIGHGKRAVTVTEREPFLPNRGNVTGGVRIEEKTKTRERIVTTNGGGEEDDGGDSHSVGGGGGERGTHGFHFDARKERDPGSEFDSVSEDGVGAGVGFGETADSCSSPTVPAQRRVEIQETGPDSTTLERILHHLHTVRDIGAQIESHFHISTLARQTYVALWEMSAHVLSTFNPESDASTVAVLFPLPSAKRKVGASGGAGGEKGSRWVGYYRAGRDVLLAVLYLVVLVHVLCLVW